MAKENIDVTVDLKNALSAPAKAAEESIEDLGDEVAELAVKQELAARAAKKHARELAALRLAATKANQVDQAGMMKAIAVNSNAAAGGVGKLGDNTRRTGKDFDFLGKILKAYKIPAIVLGITLLASAVSALGAAGFAGIAGLAPLVGLFAVMPGLITTAIGAFAAVKMGVSGIGDAVKALKEGDATKIQEAMAGLTKEGRLLAYAMADFAEGPLQSMKDATQAAVAPGFTRALTSLVPVMPLLERGLAKTADTVGDLAARAAEAMATPFFRGELRRVMAANNTTLENGGRAAGVFAGAMLGVADAFRPVQILMSEYLLLAAQYIDAQVKMGQKSGDLTAFFRRAWELGKDVGAVLRDITVALFNIGKESDAMSGMLGGGLKEITAEWRAWTETVEGRQSIRNWFEQAIPAVTQILGLLGDLGKSFGDMSTRADLAPLISQIRTQLLPAITNLVDGVVSDLGPALVDAATAFTNWMSLLSFSPIVQVFATMAAGADLLLNVLHALPAPIKTVIATLLALAFAFKLLNATSGLFRKLNSGPGLFAPIVQGAKDGSKGMGFFNRAAGGAIGAIGGLKAAGAGLSAAMGGPWMIAIMALVAAFGIYAAKQAKAKQLAESFGQTLDATTGAMTAATDEWARATLVGAEQAWWEKDIFNWGGESGNALEVAEQLGIDLATLTEAAKGSEPHLKAVNAALSGLEGDYPGQVETIRKGLDEATTAAARGTETQRVLRASLEATAHEERLAELAASGVTGEMNKQTMAAIGLTTAERGLQEVVKGTKFQLEGQKRATDAVYQATLKLNGLLSERASYVAFRQSVIDTKKALKEQKFSLDLNTQAGIDTFNTFNDLAVSAAGVEDKMKRQKALREVAGIIRAAGREAGLTGADLRDLVNDFVKVDQKAEDAKAALKALNGQGVHVTVTESGLSQIIIDADRARGSIMDLVASQGQVRVTAVATPKKARRDGGPVWAGEPFTVGEVGPELFVGPRGIEVIGMGGEQTKSFDGAGWVLPNEFYEAAKAPAPAFAGESARDPYAEAPVPAIHNHWHGSGAPTEAEIEAATLRAWQKFDRERRERR